jgi:F-type H+-transporting ATPase subunit b
MKNYLTPFFLNHESEGFGINTDILDTNLVNIILLIILLVVVVGNALTNALNERQEQIIKNVEDAEKRLNEANERLQEVRSQLSQAQIIVDEIKNQTNQTKTNLLDSEFNQATQELSQRFNNALLVLKYREQKVFSEIMEQVSEIALNQVVSKLQTQLGKTEQSLIIDTKIKQLGGSI